MIKIYTDERTYQVISEIERVTIAGKLFFRFLNKEFISNETKLVYMDPIYIKRVEADIE